MNRKDKRSVNKAVADGGSDVSSLISRPMENQSIPSQAGDTVQESRVDFLLDVVRRAPVLESLQRESVASSELCETVEMSRSTVHRAVKSLEDYDIIQQSNGKYELTSLGQILATEMQTFGTRSYTALSLKKFLNSVEMDSNRIPVEHFSEAKTTRRTQRQPHATIHQIIKLIERYDDIKMFSTVVSPVHVDLGYREMMKGTTIEAIFDQQAVDCIAVQYPKKARETVSTGNFDVYAHESLPFELFIFEDKIGLAAHNENGNAEILIESENISAIEWAENLYAEHLDDAEAAFVSD